MEQTINKIKAELVNEFEFEKDKNNMYAYNFKATVNIKVNNAIKEIILSYGKNEDIVKVSVDPNWISTIQNLGIIIDWENVKAAYRKELSKKVEENNETKKKNLGDHYDKSWVHAFMDAFNSLDDNHGVEAKIDKTREEFIEKGETYHGLNIDITYQNITTEVSYQKCGGDWRGHGGSYRYVIDSSITDYKRKSYTKIQSLIKKFKEIVDNKIETEAIKQKEKKEEAMRKETLLKHLKDTFGYEVKEEKAWKSNPWARGSQPRGYTYTVYYLVINSERKMKISCGDDDTYCLGGISDINAKQVKKIIEVVK